MVAPLIGGVGLASAAAAGGGMSMASLGSLLGGAGMAAGGISGLFSGGRGSTPDTSTFYQNWRNDDMAWSREQFDRNEELQREFAQNGVTWRTADLKRAADQYGFHPLALLGQQGSGYSPVVTAGGGNYNVDFGRPGRDEHIGSSLAQMGQGIGRAVASTQTPQERVMSAVELVQQGQRAAMGEKQLQLMDLQIQSAQINLARQSQGPGMPAYMSKSVPDPTPGHTSPSDPLGTRYIDPYSGRTTLPQKDVNIDEVSSPGWMSFMYTNRLLPLINQLKDTVGLPADNSARPSNSTLPPGATGWHFAFPGRWIPTYPSMPSTRRGHLSEPGYSYHGSY